MEFRWSPHQTISQDAIERMKEHFKKPDYDPPEAWFNTPNQRYFRNLMEALVGDPPDLSYIEHYLFDVGGGLKNFGRFDEWVEWFHCLLPYLLERIYEDELLVHTLNYFMNLYLNDIVEEYPGFSEDIFNTLATAIMADRLWKDGDLAIDYWQLDDWSGYWNSELCASMFFCLKYLKPIQIPSWVDSIANIHGEQWQKHISWWLTGASRFFYYSDHPDRVPKLSKTLKEHDIQYLLEKAEIDWNGSYIIFSGYLSPASITDFLPSENIDIFWQEVRKHNSLSYTEMK